jgi:sulfur carrier protein
MIEILVNGQRREAEAGLTLASLLDALDLPALRVAVERNGRVVPRGSFATEPVEAGDRFEMVTLVGGG